MLTDFAHHICIDPFLWDKRNWTFLETINIELCLLIILWIISGIWPKSLICIKRGRPNNKPRFMPVLTLKGYRSSGSLLVHLWNAWNGDKKNCNSCTTKKGEEAPNNRKNWFARSHILFELFSNKEIVVNWVEI